MITRVPAAMRPSRPHPGSMNRRANFARGLASNYGLLAVTIVYSFNSAPIALHSLAPSTFGLWLLVTTIGSYCAYIDLGMSASVLRILIDHKDEKAEGSYGMVFKTGPAVASAQGLIIAGVGSGPRAFPGFGLQYSAKSSALFSPACSWAKAFAWAYSSRPQFFPTRCKRTSGTTSETSPARRRSRQTW